MPSPSRDSRPPFDCRMCGECCKGFGGTYVTDEDIRRIAAHIGSDPAAVAARFCQPSGSRRVLAQGRNGYCVFWDRLCTIHEVKPRMCRRWPYIPSLLVDPVNWRIMADSCPGIWADAPFPVVEAAVRRTLEREAPPETPPPRP